MNKTLLALFAASIISGCGDSKNDTDNNASPLVEPSKNNNKAENIVATHVSLDTRVGFGGIPTPSTLQFQNWKKDQAAIVNIREFYKEFYKDTHSFFKFYKEKFYKDTHSFFWSLGFLSGIFIRTPIHFLSFIRRSFSFIRTPIHFFGVLFWSSDFGQKNIKIQIESGFGCLKRNEAFCGCNI